MKANPDNSKLGSEVNLRFRALDFESYYTVQRVYVCVFFQGQRGSCQREWDGFPLLPDAVITPKTPFLNFFPLLPQPNSTLHLGNRAMLMNEKRKRNAFLLCIN